MCVQCNVISQYINLMYIKEFALHSSYYESRLLYFSPGSC